MDKKKITIGIIVALMISLLIGVGANYFNSPKEHYNNHSFDKETDTENQEEAGKWEWVHNQTKLYRVDSRNIDFILKELQQRFPEKMERLKALSILRLGTPYELGCLGEGTEPDTDPLFRLDVTDCTAFVLTNTALLHSESLKEAREMMKLVNYRTGEIEFKNRLHFTSDRNEVSPFFEPITDSVAENNSRKVGVKLNKVRKDGTRLIDINWEREKEINYIPSENINEEIISSAPSPCGIAFVEEKKFQQGLDVVHEGILIDNQELFHASSAKQKVTKIDFMEYYFGSSGSPRFDGIILFEIK